MTNKSKALVVFSGGQDSTTCLFWALKNFGEVHVLTFDYGQRHRVEILAACMIADLAGVGERHEVVKVRDVLVSTSPLTSPEVELEQYSDAQSLPDGVEKTFVPMRNQFFLTIAANRAYALGCTHLVTGVCQEDSGGYPDCRQEFIDSFADTCNLGTFTGEEEGILSNLTVHTPLMYLTKAESVRMAYEDEKCWEALAFTHTAYDGKYPPTGHDHANLLREKGFTEAGLPDPLVLRAVNEGLMSLPDTANYEGCA
jgi:7-cyano-7-deazaguanine synthase